MDIWYNAILYNCMSHRIIKKNSIVTVEEDVWILSFLKLMIVWVGGPNYNIYILQMTTGDEGVHSWI